MNMESFGGLGLVGSSKTVRKKRSTPIRRPHDDSELSTTPSDENTETTLHGEEMGWEVPKNVRVVSEVVGNESKLKKVKLKVGGVTHTLHTKSISDSSSFVGSTSSTKSSPNLGSKVNVQNKPDTDKQTGLRGIPWKDFSKTGFTLAKPSSSKRRAHEDNTVPDTTKSNNNNKSKRVTKRRGSHEDDITEDDEIRYLEKVKASKIILKYGTTDYEDESGNRKIKPISKVLDLKNYKDNKKIVSQRVNGDSDYLNEEDEFVVSDNETDIKKRQRRDLAYSGLDSSPGPEIAVTTRRRALLAGKVGSSGLVEYPNGLPPAPPRKPKEQLTEVEQQLKRAEALQRRRLQVEKANRESEAEAIRKILGQDSSRKKREDKIKKRQEEIAQERISTFMDPTSNLVRWVNNPSGTIVTFPNAMGLPSIFEQKCCSYPAPREICAGPSCTNVFKYRDSQSKLPLCSLECYKAIRC